MTAPPAGLRGGRTSHRSPPPAPPQPATPATDGADDAPSKRKARKARKGSGPESRTFGGLSGMLEDINITELSAQAWTAAPWLAGFLAFAVQNLLVRLLLWLLAGQFSACRCGSNPFQNV